MYTDTEKFVNKGIDWKKNDRDLNISTINRSEPDPRKHFISFGST